MFDSRINKQKDILTDLTKQYNMLAVIKRPAEVNKGVELGKPVVINNPNCTASEGFNALVNNLRGVVK